MGRFVKEEPPGPAAEGKGERQPEGQNGDGAPIAGTTAPSQPDTGTAALEAAYNAGLHERDAQHALQIDKLAKARRRARRDRRKVRRRRNRRRQQSREPSLAKTLKAVRGLATTVQSGEEFGELSTALQRRLYDFANARLYSFLMRSLGEDYSHIIPDEKSGGPTPADGLQCWRLLRLRHAERSDSSEAYWLGAFMRTRFESTATRHTAANIRTYTRRLTELSSSYKMANVRDEPIPDSLWMVKLRKQATRSVDKSRWMRFRRRSIQVHRPSIDLPNEG